MQKSQHEGIIFFGKGGQGEAKRDGLFGLVFSNSRLQITS
jgi:hypothetical protein